MPRHPLHQLGLEVFLKAPYGVTHAHSRLFYGSYPLGTPSMRPALSRSPETHGCVTFMGVSESWLKFLKFLGWWDPLKDPLNISLLSWESGNPLVELLWCPSQLEEIGEAVSFTSSILACIQQTILGASPLHPFLGYGKASLPPPDTWVLASDGRIFTQYYFLLSFFFI